MMVAKVKRVIDNLMCLFCVQADVLLVLFRPNTHLNSIDIACIAIDRMEFRDLVTLSIAA